MVSIKKVRKQSFMISASYLSLILVTLIGAVGIFGYSFFTLNPENLAKFPYAPDIYRYTLPVFSQTQSWLGGLAVLFFVGYLLGIQALQTALIVSLIGFLSEFLGTSYGIPFGHYEYTDLLGFKILNKVPGPIPLSWFTMGASAYFITLAKPQLRGWHRILIGSALLTSWDLALDPAMSYLTPFWVWEQSGDYYGSPWVNFAGWLLVGCLIMSVFELSGWARKLPQSVWTWGTASYAANTLLPLGMVTAAGLWTATVATLASIATCLIVMAYLASRRKVSRPLAHGRSSLRYSTSEKS